nr:MAG TPA: hypothetical protein [Caudoviricetes sp.]
MRPEPSRCRCPRSHHLSTRLARTRPAVTVSISRAVSR